MQNDRTGSFCCCGPQITIPPMPNKPRPENRHRMVRVEDDLWTAAKVKAAETGTTVSAVIREALRRFVSAA